MLLLFSNNLKYAFLCNNEKIRKNKQNDRSIIVINNYFLFSNYKTLILKYQGKKKKITREDWTHRSLNLNISFDLTRTQIKCSKQMDLDENSLEASSSYRLTIFIPFLESYLSKLHDRFVQHVKRNFLNTKSVSCYNKFNFEIFFCIFLTFLNLR